MADDKGKQIKYEYDDELLKSTTDQSGTVTKYSYNSNGDISVINGPLNTIFEYDSIGRLAKMIYGNGMTAEYSYDSWSRLISIIYRKQTDIIIANYTYIYDIYGRIIAETDNDRKLYEYDKNDQIIRIASKRNVNYEYDANGNRIKMIKDGVTTTYEYNAEDQLIKKTENDIITTHEYDKNGNIIKKSGIKGATAYFYDTNNRLVQIVLSDGKTIRYAYYPDWKRLSKSVDGNTIYYYYDNDNIVTEIDANGNIIRRYSFIQDELLWVDNGKKYYFVTNHLGSVMKIIDNNGNVVNSYEYDEFGNIIQRNEQIGNDVLYTGQIYENESELYFYKNRFYDPDIGRFLSKDKAYALNRYVYVNPDGETEKIPNKRIVVKSPPNPPKVNSGVPDIVKDTQASTERVLERIKNAKEYDKIKKETKKMPVSSKTIDPRTPQRPPQRDSDVWSRRPTRQQRFMPSTQTPEGANPTKPNPALNIVDNEMKKGVFELDKLPTKSRVPGQIGVLESLEKLSSVGDIAILGLGLIHAYELKISQGDKKALPTDWKKKICNLIFKKKDTVIKNLKCFKKAFENRRNQILNGDKPTEVEMQYSMDYMIGFGYRDPATVYKYMAEDFQKRVEWLSKSSVKDCEDGSYYGQIYLYRNFIKNIPIKCGCYSNGQN